MKIHTTQKNNHSSIALYKVHLGETFFYLHTMKPNRRYIRVGTYHTCTIANLETGVTYEGHPNDQVVLTKIEAFEEVVVHKELKNNA